MSAEHDDVPPAGVTSRLAHHLSDREQESGGSAGCRRHVELCSLMNSQQKLSGGDRI